MKNKTTLGLLAMMMGAFLYASLSIGIRFLYSQGISETSVTPLFTLVVALSASLWSILFYKKELIIPKSQWKAIVFQGLVGTAGVNLLYYKALEQLSASVAITLLFLNPVFIFLFQWLVDRNKPSILRIIALCFVLVGLISISGLLDPTNESSLPLSGILLGIGASLCYGAMHINVEKRLGGIKPAVIAMYASSLATVVLFTLYGPRNILSFDMNPVSILSIGGLGVLTGLAPLLFIYYALIHIGAFTTSMIGTIELPITAMLGYWLLKETMTQGQWIGMTFILIGVLLVQFRPVQRSS